MRRHNSKTGQTSPATASPARAVKVQDLLEDRAVGAPSVSASGEAGGSTESLSRRAGKETFPVATTMSRTVASGVHADGMDNQRRPDPEVPERPRPRSYSARYKAEILDEYERLDKAGKGALLRREGLYTSLISEWRKQRDKGALAALQQRRGRPPADPRERELARLQRENARLRERLAKQARVLEVQGELSALLSRLATSSAEADPSEPTDPTS
jgi:transposase